MHPNWVRMLVELLRTLRSPGMSTFLMKYFPPRSCSGRARIGVTLTVLAEQMIKLTVIFKIAQLFAPM